MSFSTVKKKSKKAKKKLKALTAETQSNKESEPNDQMLVIKKNGTAAKVNSNGVHNQKKPKQQQQLPRLSYKDLQEQRKALPIFSARKKLLEELRRLPSAVLIGETGSGKTTQIPQVK